MNGREGVAGAARGGSLGGVTCVLFDFDFTLGDSSPAIVQSVNAGLVAVGLGVRDDAEILRTVGFPLRRKFEMLAPAASLARTPDFERAFHQEARRCMAAMTRFYEGAPEMLRALRGAGLMTGLVSTKHRVHLENILAHLGAIELFDAVIGGDDVGHAKPDPEGLLLAASRTNSAPGRCVYVGDHCVDADAARAAGMGFILMEGTRAAFASPDTVPAAALRVRRLAQILELLAISEG